MDVFWQIILTYVVPAFIGAGGYFLTALLKGMKSGNGSKIVDVTANFWEDVTKENRELRLEIKDLQEEKLNYCSTCPLKIKRSE